MSDFSQKICPNCQTQFSTDSSKLQIIDNMLSVICPICEYIIKLTPLLSENIVRHGSAVLKTGDVVQIINAEHVWRDEIAIICETKPSFYRIELKGRKVWVPHHWVQIHEPSDIN